MNMKSGPSSASGWSGPGSRASASSRPPIPAASCCRKASEQRITFPDVIREISRQTDGLFREDDFLPLPCAHPNCHSLGYAYRSGGRVVPLARFIDARNHLDLLANGITFTRVRARELIEEYLGSQSCCGGKCGPETVRKSAAKTSSRSPE